MANKNGSKGSVRTFKDTFWSTTRVAQNVSIEEVAEYIGMSRATAGMYFTGQLVPSEKTALALCELFDVDPIKGRREFIDAHKKYDAEHTRVLKASSKKSVEPVDKSDSSDKVVLDESLAKVVQDFNTKVDNALRVVYHKLSYDDFMAVSEAVRGGADVLEVLYKRVDYDTYTLLINIFYSEV